MTAGAHRGARGGQRPLRPHPPLVRRTRAATYAADYWVSPPRLNSLDPLSSLRQRFAIIKLFDVDGLRLWIERAHGGRLIRDASFRFVLVRTIEASVQDGVGPGDQSAIRPRGGPNAPNVIGGIDDASGHDG